MCVCVYITPLDSLSGTRDDTKFRDGLMQDEKNRSEEI